MEFHGMRERRLALRVNGRMFVTEKAMQTYLAENLHLIDPDLTLWGTNSGIEEILTPEASRTIQGKIDILTQQLSDGDLCAIECKNCIAKPADLGQVLGYIGWIKRNLTFTVAPRAVIVATGFSQLLLDALHVHDTLRVSLCQYCGPGDIRLVWGRGVRE